MFHLFDGIKIFIGIQWVVGVLPMLFEGFKVSPVQFREIWDIST